MADSRFYDNTGALTLARIAEITGGRIATGASGDLIADVAALDHAHPGQLSYCEGIKFKGALQRARASAVLVPEAMLTFVPATTAAIVCAHPALGLAKVAHVLYPNPSHFWSKDKPPIAPIAPSARVGEGTIIAPNVFLGEDVEIGNDCIVAFGAVIGRGVRIGHNASIGPHVSISHALIGDRCIIHGGTRIGQDGFGYIGGPGGRFKIPQLGRVIIQDDVEIGANTTIDRGAFDDTIIGEGSKIDNLIQLGHNTRLGRGCVIAAQAGFSGSITLGDGVALGGQVGIADHVKIGSGAYIAAKSGVTRSLEGGQVYGGFPAKPVKQWRREVAAVSRLAKGKRTKDERDADQD